MSKPIGQQKKNRATIPVEKAVSLRPRHAAVQLEKHGWLRGGPVEQAVLLWHRHTAAQVPKLGGIGLSTPTLHSFQDQSHSLNRAIPQGSVRQTYDAELRIC